MTMVRTIFGTAVGIALGFAVAFGNFGDMAIVGAFAIVGYAISKVVAGQFDFGASFAPLRRSQQQRSQR
ncbi:hypothetical protein [Asanoa siamensis]|uniref:DUF2273 domain-containing protein n=1 Tax=Asanoa siamensis TaxID=926357 RepID=A0ABQ4D3H0_9ACTN|nr:hypothetical protein [Asanoa siamensis]GIF78087.1 hypothetical protein Asi02nite_76050 [Asanoa siamensis]